jgi:hypothetical protein
LVEISPIGGNGGLARKDQVAGVQKVIAVLISAGILIDMMQLIVRRNGDPQAMVQHGGDGGHFTPFVLADNEYLIGITGRYSLYVSSITLHTNIRTSQRFGGNTGEKDFNISANSGEQIVGLWCRSEQYIDAIGAITAPIGY